MGIFLNGLLRNSCFYRLQNKLDSFRGYAKEATVPISPAECHLIDKNQLPTQAKVTREEALEIYKQMQLIRRMETEAANMYKAQAIFGFCHLYAGMEAVATGINAILKNKDDLITSYRCHAWAMLCFNRLKKNGVQLVLSELSGKIGGGSEGRGGSMHLYASPTMYGGQAIVGAQVPLGVGLAFAHKYKNDNSVSYVLYGDGAANQGQVYESFNIAMLKELPAVFICENNVYGMGTHHKRATASPDYYRAGRVIPGLKIDGMDVFTVRELTKVASEYARAGCGPIIVEMDTYRYFGHSMSDPGTSYRSREEVQEVRKTRDPISKLKDVIVSNKLATEDELKKINAEIKKFCEEARKEAVNSAFPEAGNELKHIYSLPLERPRNCSGFPTQ